MLKGCYKSRLAVGQCGRTPPSREDLSRGIFASVVDDLDMDRNL